LATAVDLAHDRTPFAIKSSRSRCAAEPRVRLVWDENHRADPRFARNKISTSISEASSIAARFQIFRVWRLTSITMEADFCIEALEEALARHGRPEIFNTDQGLQFTSAAFTDVLLKAGVAIGMDGKGSWRDNVFVERLWRSVKYEEVYLRAYASVAEARASIASYLRFYNSRRPHSSLDRQTPDQAYFNRLSQIAAA
jgi:transposase InsO family protein